MLPKKFRKVEMLSASSNEAGLWGGLRAALRAAARNSKFSAAEDRRRPVAASLFERLETRAVGEKRKTAMEMEIRTASSNIE